MSKARALIAALVACASLPSCAFGQAATGQLSVQVLTREGDPVGGALVALIDSNDQVVIEAVTSESGRRSLAASVGTYRLRVRRIGFAPFYALGVSVPRTGTLAVHVDTDRISLKTVLVSGSGQCRQVATDASTLALAWAEIEKALRTSQLTRGDLTNLGQARNFKREIGLEGEVISEELTFIPVANQRPFGVVAPTDLATKGYVRGDMYSGWDFFGPDETVLLSSEFARTHCFTVVRDATRSGQIGVGFRPIPKRKVADIKGTLWLDEASSELRSMAFQYTNAQLPANLTGGGETRFRRLPSGSWIVDDWKLTMPRIEQKTRTIEQFGIHTTDYVQVGSIEVGGKLVENVSRAPLMPGMTRVAGVVYDSLHEKSLSGATVTLDDVSVRSDRNGRFSFSSVAAGSHKISFSHPALRSLGLSAIERDIDATGPDNNVYLVLPSLTSAWPRLCHDTASRTPGDDSRGVLHGMLRNSEGAPVDGGRLRITYHQVLDAGEVRALSPPDFRLDVLTGSTGQYSACGFSSKTRGTLEVMINQKATARSRFDFSKNPIIQLDMVTDQVARPKTIAVTGFIRSRAGKPIAFAVVVDQLSSRFAVSDSIGRFTINSTPAGGTIPLSVQRLGYARRDTVVEAVNAGPMNLRIVLDSPGRSVGTDVTGYSEALDSAGFYRRMSLASHAQFIQGHEIAALAPNQTTDVLRQSSELEIISLDGVAGDGDFPVVVSNGCPMTLYVNGRLTEYITTISPQDSVAISHQSRGADVTKTFGALLPADIVEGMEIYANASSVPAEFRIDRKECGVLVIWTKSPQMMQ